MASSKVAVVTGSNKGIGFAIVKKLCQKFDGVVYLTSRDEGRGKAAVAELEKMGLKPQFHQLNIDSLESIKAFRDYLEKNHGGIDILVNNAGMAYSYNAKNSFAEQAENTVATNFFHTLEVCQELFPLLKPHARVVHLSSVAGHLSLINGKEPEATDLRRKLSSPDATEAQIRELAQSFINASKEGVHYEQGWPNSAYATSKVLLSAVTPIQQREFDKLRPGQDIVVNSVHPGYVDTDMTSHNGQLTTDEGAVAPVWAALLPPNTQSPKGAYIWCDTTVVDWVNGPLPY